MIKEKRWLCLARQWDLPKINPMRSLKSIPLRLKNEVLLLLEQQLEQVDKWNGRKDLAGLGIPQESENSQELTNNGFDSDRETDEYDLPTC